MHGLPKGFFFLMDPSAWLGLSSSSSSRITFLERVGRISWSESESIIVNNWVSRLLLMVMISSLIIVSVASRRDKAFLASGSKGLDRAAHSSNFLEIAVDKTPHVVAAA